MVYEHWQRGVLVLWFVLGGLTLVVALGVVMWLSGAPWYLWAPILAPVVIVLALCAYGFRGLGVTVDGENIRVWFGGGWMSRCIALADVKDVVRVRNDWWMGWGVRLIGSSTTLWNVSGMEAVELRLRSGRAFRVGTDDAEGLQAAVERVVAGRIVNR